MIGKTLIGKRYYQQTGWKYILAHHQTTGTTEESKYEKYGIWIN
jgi:hypothetical protein